jgi:hypothetical protein
MKGDWIGLFPNGKGMGCSFIHGEGRRMDILAINT